MSRHILSGLKVLLAISGIYLGSAVLTSLPQLFVQLSVEMGWITPAVL
ncbi:hypothetical protein ACQKP8_19495 [Photobacterium alginatilyticum]|nr:MULTISPECIES: hypothetical protein [Photobacterium]MCG7587213.1 hypothetical protein [Photobacterium sp. OFAV2-7]